MESAQYINTLRTFDLICEIKGLGRALMVFTELHVPETDSASAWMLACYV